MPQRRRAERSHGGGGGGERSHGGGGGGERSHGGGGGGGLSVTSSTGRKTPRDAGERLEVMPDERLASDLAAAHARTPYALVVVQLSSDGVDTQLGALVGEVRKAEKQSAKGKAASGAPATPPTRVVCVRGDRSPPPVWRMWVPSFCSRAFVREMRLRR